MHKSVLLNEVIEYLDPKEGETIFDGTAGEGGHSKEIAKHLGRSGKLIVTDLDEEALRRTKEKFALQKNSCTDIHLIHASFRDIKLVLKSERINKVDGILLDLGLSSYQLDESPRGFSFNRDEPLVMTFESDKSRVAFTAHDIVNTWAEESISDILFGFADERYSRHIAEAIVKTRGVAPIVTTRELVAIIESSVPDGYKRTKLHPATRTFQALRMAVNDELGAISQVLDDGWSVLESGGRMVVISFHEHEDRLVKKFYKTKRNDGEIITKKVVTPDKKEIRRNPRSRSAKLRAIRKI